MKKAKDYWSSVFDDFASRRPDMAEDVVDWYPSGQYEIVVKLRSGKRYIYDWRLQLVYRLIEKYDEEDVTEEMWRKKFRFKLCDKMRRMCVNQYELSIRSGITNVTISKYMNGKATPSAYNLERIARALECSVSELIY